MLLTIILLQRKRLHSKLNFELCLSVMKLGKPSSRPVNAGSMYRAVVRDRVSSVGLRGWWTVYKWYERERQSWAWLNAAGERYERERHGPSDGRRSTQGGRHERLSCRQPRSHSSLRLRGTTHTHSLLTCVSLSLSLSLSLCVSVRYDTIYLACTAELWQIAAVTMSECLRRLSSLWENLPTISIQAMWHFFVGKFHSRPREDL